MSIANSARVTRHTWNYNVCFVNRWFIICNIHCFFCLLACFAPGWVLPLSASSRSDPDYLIDTWEIQQGMPDNSATTIVQAPDGYLWIGTFNGLVQFDGAKFKVFDSSNVPELPSPGIVNLHMDGSGCLWVSTLRGLTARKAGHWL